MFANVTFCSKDECMFDSFYALLKDLALEVGFLLRLRPNPVQQSVFSIENHCDHFCYYLMECVMLLS